MPNNVSSKIESFFAEYRMRQYAKGQILLLNGDEATHVYYLSKGMVKQYDVSYRGDELILNIFKPSSFFPMSLAVNGGINPYIYEAETDIEVRQAPIRDVMKYVMSNPDVLVDLLSRVYRGMDGMIGRMVHLMSSNARNRLLYEIQTEALRFGVKQEDGSYLLAASEKELGARSGLSRETVSREVHKLKTEKLITLDRSGMIVKDLKALEELLLK
jgi:CRP-like cAMP-binding protein